MPPSQSAQPSQIDLHIGFVLAGMATTLLGPIVPVLSRAWALPDSMTGTIFSAQFVSSTTLTIASAALVLRFDAARVMTTGFLLMAIGIGTLGLVPWPWGLAATVCYGCGLGLVLPTTNFLVATANPGRESSAVSLVNVSWSLGAVTWPVLVALLKRPGSVARPTLLLAALMLAVAFRLARAHVIVPPRREAAVAGRPASETPPALRLVSPWVVVIFGALMFVYAGTESTVGGWVAEYLRRLAPTSASWTLAPTYFWAAILTGRLLTPLALRVVSEPALLFASLLLALAASLALVSTSSPLLARAAATGAGLGLAPVFPVTFAGMSQQVGPTRPRLLGPLYALTGIGSAVLPWIVGAVSSKTGSLRTGLLVAAAGASVLIALTAMRVRMRDGFAR